MNEIVGKFPLGQLSVSAGAKTALKDANQEPWGFLARHLIGKWGAVSDEGWAKNDAALVEGKPVLSAYETSKGVRFVVISTGDRSETWVLLETEYRDVEGS